jgi:hypothetical protein
MEVTPTDDDIYQTDTGVPAPVPAPVVSKRKTERDPNAPVRAEDLDWFYVKSSHPSLNKQIRFRTISEKRARAFIMNRYPRGSEAYLEKPDGTYEHYEQERQGDMGADVDLWATFDPNAWIPPDQQAPPGQDAWSDKEG